MSSSDAVAVKVAVRVRPMNETKEAGCEVVIEMDGGETRITDPSTNKTERFTFDYSYWWDTPQDKVYQDLGRPMLENALDGYNGTVFAYGQTGSGKSFSMMGGPNDLRGITPRLNEDLFKLISDKPKNQEYSVYVTYLEIYQEKLRDLLNPSSKELKIRESKKLGFVVPDLYKAPVKTTEEIVSLMEEGNAVRVVAATKMNDHSSRSHSVFTIHLRMVDKNDVQAGALTAKINLVDLAGSERADSTGATGEVLKQGAAINQSLTALGRVIRVLAGERKKGEFVPYRDSVLTKVLRESLGGNSQTVMLAALSPADKNHDETLSTLKYANSAKNIKNKSRKNEDKNTKLIRELREQIEALRSGMMGGSSSGGGLDASSMAEYQEKMEELELAKSQTFEQVEQQKKELEEERQRNLRQRGVMEALKTNLKQQNEERIEQLRSAKEAKLAKFQEAKSKLMAVKEQYQKDVMAFQESGQQDEQLRAKIAKEKKFLENGGRAMEQLKAEYTVVEQELQDEMALGQTDDLLTLQQKEMERLKEKQARELQLMQNKMQAAMQARKQAMEEKFQQMASDSVSKEEHYQMQVELEEMRGAKEMLEAQLKMAQKENARLQSVIDEEQLKHEHEMEKERLSLFRMFRKYREFAEEEYRDRERKLLVMVEHSVTDAIYLNAKVQELEAAAGSSSGGGGGQSSSG